MDKWQIGLALRSLLDDSSYWINNKLYSEEEIAIQFKHRIVSIYCFVNGNGMHSRLMADILMEKIFKRPVFTWGAGNLIKTGDARTTYLKAIRVADGGDYRPLLEFAKS